MTTHLQEVRAKIIEAVPEIEKRWTEHTPMGTLVRVVDERPITLADVLKSFQGNTKAPVGVDMNGRFLDCDDDMTEWKILDVRWNLALPLDDQEPEVIEFLHKILV